MVTEQTDMDMVGVLPTLAHDPSDDKGATLRAA